VRGLNSSDDEASIIKIFSSYGDFAEKDLFEFNDSLCFFTYETHEQATAAIAGTNKTYFEGSKLFVKFTSSKPPDNSKLIKDLLEGATQYFDSQLKRD
jgi:RNA recognition motif-containing protein